MTAGMEELPPGWEWTTLGEIADVKGGVTKGQRRAPGTEVRSVPYLRVANVQRGYLDLTDVRSIDVTEEEVADLALRPGDVLFTEGGDRDKLGRGWVWGGELPLCIHQNHVFRARVRTPQVEPKYLSLYANTLGQAYFVAEGRQTTNLASINLSKLLGLPIAIPPAAEQRRIVAEVDKQLSRLDATVRALHQSATRLERYRASVLSAACRGQLALQARNGRADGVGAQRWVESPPSWNVLTVAQLSASGEQPVLTGPFGTSLSSGDFTSSGVPVLTIGCLTNAGVRLDKAVFVSAVKAAELERYRVRAGDVLFSRMASVGRAGLIPPSLAGSLINYHVMRLRLNPEVVLPAFFLIYVRGSVRVQRYLREINHGATRDGINTEQLLQMPVALPLLAEQRWIVSEVERRLSVVEQLEAAINANLERCGRLRQAILKKAFQGKLVAQDQDDEPASVLLERIRAERELVAPAKRRARTGRTSARRTSKGGEAPEVVSRFRTERRAAEERAGYRQGSLPELDEGQP